MICTHHYSVRQNVFTNLKILCAPEELKVFGKRVLTGGGGGGNLERAGVGLQLWEEG